MHIIIIYYNQYYYSYIFIIKDFFNLKTYKPSFFDALVITASLIKNIYNLLTLCCKSKTIKK